MRTLLEYALANAAAATALALVALVVGSVVRRPAVRNALWLLVLVRLVLPPLWTVPVPVPVADPDPVEVALAVVDPIPPAPVPADVGDWEGYELTGEELPAAVAEPVDAAAVVEAAPFPTYAAIGVVWAIGCGFVFARSAWRVGRFRRALRDASPAPDAIQHQAASLATAMGLRRCPTVLVVPGRASPALWMPGLFPRQAKVLLPAGLVSILDPGQRAAVLAHELAHLRRGDPWVRWLEVVVCGLYWWFPLVVWFRRHLRASEEACCDLWVVAALGGRRAYATALVETAAYLGGPDRVASPVLASGAGPVLDLQRRVEMIMQATWPARLTRFGLATVLGFGVAGLSFGPALAQPPERDRDRGRDERKDPPKDRERPKDGDRDRPREERPRDGDRRPDAPRDKASEADIQKARADYDKARREAQEATQRMMEAEEKLAKAEGRAPRKFPGGVAGPGGFGGAFPGGGGFGGGGPGGFGGFGGGGPGGVGGFGGGGRGVPPKEGDRRPDVERPKEERRPDPRPEGRPDVRPEGRGPGGEFRELQQQIEELRRALEQMRQEMRRGGGEKR